MPLENIGCRCDGRCCGAFDNLVARFCNDTVAQETEIRADNT